MIGSTEILIVFAIIIFIILQVLSLMVISYLVHRFLINSILDCDSTTHFIHFFHFISPRVPLQKKDERDLLK
jgi:hypothetical protein